MLSAKGIFDFSSETAERNSTKLKRKQDVNVPLPSLCFRADRKKQDGRPGLCFVETHFTVTLDYIVAKKLNLAIDFLIYRFRNIKIIAKSEFVLFLCTASVKLSLTQVSSYTGIVFSSDLLYRFV